MVLRIRKAHKCLERVATRPPEDSAPPTGSASSPQRGKSAGNTEVASAPRQDPWVAAPTQADQPISSARATTGFPRPSELFDNWAGGGLPIAVLLLQKRAAETVRRRPWSCAP